MDVLRHAQPSRLFIVSDGPRPDRPGEAEQVAEVRACVEASVDWPCAVMKNYAEHNMGCDPRVVSGISWVFSIVDEAIILEDDCIPDPSFINFATAMLARYRDDTRVMHVAGCNYFEGAEVSGGSYYFSQYPLTWGWATWARSWKLFDYDLSLWRNAEVREAIRIQRTVCGDYTYWAREFDKIISGKGDWWDYKWIFCCWVNGGVAVVPNVNMISNMGFRGDATHTTDSNSIMAGRGIKSMSGDYIPPAFAIVPSSRDVYFGRKYCGQKSILVRVWNRLNRIFLTRFL
jgi:hypothetical protein